MREGERECVCNLIFERRHEVAGLLEINEILSKYVFVRGGRRE